MGVNSQITSLDARYGGLLRALAKVLGAIRAVDVGIGADRIVHHRVSSQQFTSRCKYFTEQQPTLVEIPALTDHTGSTSQLPVVLVFAAWVTRLKDRWTRSRACVDNIYRPKDTHNTVIARR